jgi:hypothetical protein
MTASERFIQLAAEEASSLQDRARLLAFTCGFAIYYAVSYVNYEVKWQYGQGFTWTTAGIWLRRFLFVYFVPSVLFTEFLIQAAQHTALFEWPMTEIAPKNRYFSESSMTTIYGIIYVASPLLYVIAMSRFRYSKLTPGPLPSATMDMSKWAQDESGQWFRVTYRNGDDVLYDRSKPYEERAVAWIKTKRYVKKWGWIGFLSAICFIISYFLMDDGRTPHNYVDLAARGVFCFAGAFAFISFLNWSVAGSYLAEGEANFVGPPPTGTAGRGVEQVEKQKVYGEGGFATREEIHAAAHGRSAAQGGAVGRADDIEFDD